MRRRLAFFGSPAWAVPVLEALAAHHEVVLVVTQPDKPAGRGLALTPAPVAEAAARLGLPVEKPARLKGNAAFLERFKTLGLDAAVTAAYGKLLPPELLEVPRHGFLNLHPSLLPKYRGAAPVQWALIRGERETGVTIMRTDAGLDTGPILLQWRTPIHPDETALELAERLRDKGIQLLLEALERLEDLEPRPQPADGTYAPLLTKEDGRIRWTDPARAVYDRHRGVQPWPGSWFMHARDGGGRVRVKVHALFPAEGQGAPGEVLAVEPEGVRVAVGEGAVRLVEVQPEGKRRMPAADWARGYGLRVGARLE
ncbi:methionyl-tRNA formyltransferase [Marinithermus hydrothermalis]|uniref:Methionyl-tRNA formyltransferase n=1 Tax=Marinithermus hydrothermalis (strain DSM 14884 / JCM 11576 / T1) TaxID=869210 RepID=F2NR11_MARHT|nr:methionyl-tRNA formyltransferase [Marinithermus hydrothermalis]AEB12589.1 Methionyl-tRNA formyltransferase [Marinithermus hydrothermalis DSM 14884]